MDLGPLLQQKTFLTAEPPPGPLHGFIILDKTASKMPPPIIPDDPAGEKINMGLPREVAGTSW